MSLSTSKRIAVIGSGISGMVAAYKLSMHYDVTMFEAGDYVGGHTNTIRVECDGEVQHVDTGFIVFNEHNYPNFVALMNELGVASQPTCMSFSVRCEDSGLEYNGTSPNKLFAQRRNLLRPKFWGMLKQVLRFSRESLILLEQTGPGPTVREYVEAKGYSHEFVEHYLVPLGTSLWSTPAQTFRDFPIKFVVRFLSNHNMLQVGGRPTWRVIQGGSFRYVEKLTARYASRIRLSCPAQSVLRFPDGVCVESSGYGSEWYDHVVFACHADQALRLLADPSPVERELLGAFPYQPNEAVLHTDTSVLPRNRRAWASWNATVSDRQRDSVAVTYNMNILQSLKSKHTFCVTLNDQGTIDPTKVIRRLKYHHPIYTLEQEHAQSRHHEIIDKNRSSYCGAYWGFGFHEDGVRSALAVCNAIIHKAVHQEAVHA